MTENETKAVKFIENIKNHATVTLDHIAKEEPNVSPLVYKGREEKANTILVMVEELKQYRALGTPEELKELKERAFDGMELAQIAAALMRLKEYERIGTPEECRAAVEKQTAKLVIDNTPTEDSVWYQCPTCKGDLTTIRGFYCQYCGQKLHWR